MVTRELFRLTPGDVILLSCSAAIRESMTESVSALMPPEFAERTLYNTSPVIHVDVAHDDRPGNFADLANLIGRLILAGGKRSRFRGMLVINIEGLNPSFDEERLKALGELLNDPGGLASECVTVIHGPQNETDLLTYAELLDTDGRLLADVWEREETTLEEALRSLNLKPEDEDTAALLKSALRGTEGSRGFDLSRYLTSLASGDGIITRADIEKSTAAPLSYLNRCKTRNKSARNERVIGFRD